MEELLTRRSAGVVAPGPPLGPEEPPGRPGGHAGRAAGPVAGSIGPDQAAPGPLGRLVAWEHFDLALLVALVVLSLALRWRTLWASYWGDEAIAIGIAAQPLKALPHALNNDGSPPLYYVVLHFWMRAFGRSELATHTLSMIAALLAVPAAWWCALRVFGRWAGRGAAALVATCAYLDYYSTETRMYSWLVLAAMLAVTCFVLAYQGAGRRYWAAATALMGVVLYLQYYGLYLFGAVLLAGAGLAIWDGSRQRLKATLLYGLASAAIFSPWAPQFVGQVLHTGAPWAPRPSVLDLFGDSFNALASAAWAAVVVGIIVSVLARRRAAGRRAPPGNPARLHPSCPQSSPC